MDHIDTREGWREIGSTRELKNGDRYLVEAEYLGPARSVRYWVHEDPVPPLPKVPHTTIRVTWSSRQHAVSEYTLNEHGWWCPEEGMRNALRGDYFPGRITGFKVLAKPVSELAEASARVDAEDRELAKTIILRMLELRPDKNGIDPVATQLTEEFVENA